MSPHPLMIGLFAVSLACDALERHRSSSEGVVPTKLAFPCEDYRRGLRGQGNFGVRVDAKGSPFHRTWHLAEDVWLAPKTTVRAIADGEVRYSAFSPTWTDARGAVHWNLGNTIVLEHALVPPEDGAERICSFYVHLGADRRVQVGERVRCGQVIGAIGADRSEENGRYPAHLHFGIHRGPYFQIAPTTSRELGSAAASKDGLRFGNLVLRGELRLELHDESTLRITAVESGEVALFSLLVGSTAPVDPPPDIMGWCQGYGAEATVAEWICPSKFLRERGASQ